MGNAASGLSGIFRRALPVGTVSNKIEPVPVDVDAREYMGITRPFRSESMAYE